MAQKYLIQWFGQYSDERKRLEDEQFPCFRWFGWPVADEPYNISDESRLALYVAIAWCAPYRVHMLHLRPAVASADLFTQLRPHVIETINRMGKDSKRMRKQIAPDALKRLSKSAPSLPPPNMALGWRIQKSTKTDDVRRFCELPGDKKFLIAGTLEAVDLLPYMPHSRFAWRCRYKTCGWDNDIYLPARRSAAWCVACGAPTRAKGLRRNWTHEIGALVIVYNGPRDGRIKYWRSHAIASKFAGIRCVTMTGWGGAIRSWDSLFGSWRNDR